MAKVFRLHYERYHLVRQRPLGAGAFFDFVTDAARLHGPLPKSSLWGFPHRAAPGAAEANEERWEEEGGNTRTHVARRAHRRL